MVNILFVYAMDTERGEVTDLVTSAVLFTMNVAGLGGCADWAEAFPEQS